MTDEIPESLLRQWHINSQFQSLEKEHIKNKIQFVPTAKQEPKPFRLEEPFFTKWKRALSGKESSCGKLREGFENLNNMVEKLETFQILNKNFTSKESHEGNSLVEFYLGSAQRFGQISFIFRSSQSSNKTWLTISPFKEVSRDDLTKDPYKNHPDLNCCLLLSEFRALVVVDCKRIIGHAAILKNPKGTFGITKETTCAVGLCSLVRLIPLTPPNCF